MTLPPLGQPKIFATTSPEKRGAGERSVFGNEERTGKARRQT